MTDDTKNDLTMDQLKRALPATLRTSASQELLDKLNGAAADPMVAQTIRENFVSYISVMKDGKFKAEDYLNAVKYVSYKLMGQTNERAYELAFPDRYEKLIARGATKKDISAYTGAYHRNKLVCLIMEQCLVPTWVLNQDIHQQAVNRLAYLMMNAGSEKVQADSAIALMTQLKKPDTKEINLNLGVEENSGVRELQDTLHKLAKAQQSAIQNGQTTREIASQTIYEAEYTDVPDD